MKKIFKIILFMLIGFVAKAQLPSSTFPSRIFNGNTKAQWILLDSPLVNPILDTFNARYPGTQIIRIQGGDTAFWFNAAPHIWFRSLFSRDTISLSNRINLKLNITDTTAKWWGIGKRWVDTVYRKNDSTIGFTINNGAEQTFQILGRSSGGGGGSGTVTSVGLSMPSAFSVSGSPITTSGTFNVSGAGTTAQYIRGNGTLATTDTGMIPNFYLKVRSLLSGISPITYNSTTGAIGIPNANTSGTKGAATFLNSDFSDNGSGLISLSTLVSSGVCTNCNITFGADGRATAYANGIGPSGNPVDTIYRIPGKDSIFYTINSIVRAIKDSTGGGFSNNNVGGGFRWVATAAGNIKTVFPSNTVLWDSTSNANGLTGKVDTSVIATQYDLTQITTPPASPLNSIQYNNGGVFGGDSLQYYPIDNKLLTSQDFIQYGRPSTGFFQDSTSSSTHGYLWMSYPRHSNGYPGQPVQPSWGADTLQPFYSELNSQLYDINQPENPVFNILKFGNYGSYRPMARIALEQNYLHGIEYHAFVTKPWYMNPNDEIRHQGWTVDDRTGYGVVDFRICGAGFAYSDVTSPDYNRPYCGLGRGGILAQTYGAAFGEIAINHGNSPGKRMGMFVDTASNGGLGFSALYVSTSTSQLNIGAQGGATAIDITNPATSGGLIKCYKPLVTLGKQIQAANIPNSSDAFSIIGSLGFAWKTSIDGTGHANTFSDGSILIHRDPAGFSSSDKIFQIYNNFNFNDNLFYVRGDGNTFTKGLVNVQTLKTTLTAPATEGTTKMVISDTNGLLSFTDIPSSSTTLYNGNGTLTSDRNVSSGGFTLRVEGINNSDTLVSVINNGTTSTGLYAFGSALGINITSTGTGIQSFGSTRGAIFTGDTDEGILVKSNAVRGARIQTVPSSTNTVVENLQLERGSSGGAGGNGIGQYISFLNKGSDNGSYEANTIISKLTDATAATRTSQLSITGVNNASTVTLATFDGNGNVTFGTTNSIVGTATNNNAVAGNIGEEVNSTVSTYANYTTTATYQNITSITLSAGDWDLTAQGTFSTNGATITAGNDAIFVISTTTASASGATEGKNISYVPQAALLGTSHESITIAPYRVSLSSSTTYYLNSQATFTVGNPQFVGSLRARRIR